MRLMQLQTGGGEFTVTPGRMLAMEQKVLDRIAFGRVKELEALALH